jgi:hypothetical protein
MSQVTQKVEIHPGQIPRTLVVVQLAIVWYTGR